MLDFNMIINEAIKSAITTAVEQAVTEQNDLIRTLMDEVRDLNQQVQNLQTKLDEVPSESDIERIAAELMQSMTNMCNNSNNMDEVLGTEEFSQAVREVIRDCL